MSQIKKSIVCLLAILLIMLTPLQAYAATGIEGLTDVNGFTVANASTTVWGLSSSAAGTMFYLCDKNGNKVATDKIVYVGNGYRTGFESYKGSADKSYWKDKFGWYSNIQPAVGYSGSTVAVEVSGAAHNLDPEFTATSLYNFIAANWGESFAKQADASEVYLLYEPFVYWRPLMHVTRNLTFEYDGKTLTTAKQIVAALTNIGLSVSADTVNAELYVTKTDKTVVAGVGQLAANYNALGNTGVNSSTSTCYAYASGSNKSKLCNLSQSGGGMIGGVPYKFSTAPTVQGLNVSQSTFSRMSTALNATLPSGKVLAGVGGVRLVNATSPDDVPITPDPATPGTYREYDTLITHMPQELDWTEHSHKLRAVYNVMAGTDKLDYMFDTLSGVPTSSLFYINFGQVLTNYANYSTLKYNTNGVRTITLQTTINNSWGDNNPDTLSGVTHQVWSGGNEAHSTAGSASGDSPGPPGAPSKCTVCGATVTAPATPAPGFTEVLDPETGEVVSKTPKTASGASVSCGCHASVTYNDATGTVSCSGPVTATASSTLVHGQYYITTVSWHCPGGKSGSWSFGDQGILSEGYTVGKGTAISPNINCVHNTSTKVNKVIQEKYDVMFFFQLNELRTFSPAYFNITSDQPDTQTSLANGIGCGSSNVHYSIEYGIDYWFADNTWYNLGSTSGGTGAMYFTNFVNTEYCDGGFWTSTKPTTGYYTGNCVMYFTTTATKCTDTTAANTTTYGSDNGEFKPVQSTETVYRSGHKGRPMTAADYQAQANYCSNTWMGVQNTQKYSITGISEYQFYNLPKDDMSYYMGGYVYSIDKGISLFDEKFTGNNSVIVKEHVNINNEDSMYQAVKNGTSNKSLAIRLGAFAGWSDKLYDRDEYGLYHVYRNSDSLNQLLTTGKVPFAWSGLYFGPDINPAYLAPCYTRTINAGNTTSPSTSGSGHFKDSTTATATGSKTVSVSDNIQTYSKTVPLYKTTRTVGGSTVYSFENSQIMDKGGKARALGLTVANSTNNGAYPRLLYVNDFQSNNVRLTPVGRKGSANSILASNGFPTTDPPNEVTTAGITNSEGNNKTQDVVIYDEVSVTNYDVIGTVDYQKSELIDTRINGKTGNPMLSTQYWTAVKTNMFESPWAEKPSDYASPSVPHNAKELSPWYISGIDNGPTNTERWYKSCWIAFPTYTYVKLKTGDKLASPKEWVQYSIEDLENYSIDGKTYHVLAVRPATNAGTLDNTHIVCYNIAFNSTETTPPAYDTVLADSIHYSTNNTRQVLGANAEHHAAKCIKVDYISNIGNLHVSKIDSSRLKDGATPRMQKLDILNYGPNRLGNSMVVKAFEAKGKDFSSFSITANEKSNAMYWNSQGQTLPITAEIFVAPYNAGHVPLGYKLSGDVETVGTPHKLYKNFEQLWTAGDLSKSGCVEIKSHYTLFNQDDNTFKEVKLFASDSDDTYKLIYPDDANNLSNLVQDPAATYHEGTTLGDATARSTLSVDFRDYANYIYPSVNGDTWTDELVKVDSYPHSIGNANKVILTGADRGFIGSQKILTNDTSIDLNCNKYVTRWFFTLGLPSSTVLVPSDYSGPSDLASLREANNQLAEDNPNAILLHSVEVIYHDAYADYKIDSSTVYDASTDETLEKFHELYKEDRGFVIMELDPYSSIKDNYTSEGVY